MWLSRRKGVAPTGGSEAVEEAVRLLDGRVAERYAGQWAPVWVAVNALAHSDEARLLAMAAQAARSGTRTEGGWLGRLAAEVLVVAPTEAELVQLQREVLVPLELQLLDDRLTFPASPGHLVELILAGIDGYLVDEPSTRGSTRNERRRDRRHR